jgi:lysozyme
MELSAVGVTLVKRSEGYRSRVYLDISGIPTIGYGHRLQHPETFPKGIDEQQAMQILANDVREAEWAVEHLVKVPLMQGQFDALVDFVFNLGSSRLASSTLLKILNEGRYEDAVEQLLLWDHAGSGESTALKTRREAEAKLWQTESLQHETAA